MIPITREEAEVFGYREFEKRVCFGMTSSERARPVDVVVARAKELFPEAFETLEAFKAAGSDRDPSVFDGLCGVALVSVFYALVTEEISTRDYGVSATLYRHVVGRLTAELVED